MSFQRKNLTAGASGAAGSVPRLFGRSLVSACQSMETSSMRTINSPFALLTITNLGSRREYELDDNRKHYRLSIPKSGHDDRPRMHSHNYCELSFVLKGTIDVQTEGLIHCYRSGDIYLINKNTRHREIYHGDAVIAYCAMTDSLLENWPQERFSSLYPAENDPLDRFFRATEGGGPGAKSLVEFRCLDLIGMNRVKFLLETMQSELQHRQPGYLFMLYGLMQRLFSLLADPSLYGSKYLELNPSAEETLVDTIKDYIRSHRGRLPCTDLELAFHYNRDYLNRVFRRHTGMTISDFRQINCMREAEYLLRDSGNSVEQVAEKLGYSKSQFYRQFQKYFGMTPSQWRLAESGSASPAPR